MKAVRIPTFLLNTKRLFFAFFLFCQFANAQLDAFTLGVAVTNESCTANGKLTFTVQNTTAGATMLYTVFHLPDTTTPIAILSTTTLTGLVAGDYRVVAMQSLGGQSATKQQDVTVVSTIVTLDYIVTGVKEICGNDGSITINITSGVGVSYEIISGPVIKPLQPSNTFTGLPAGQYVVRAFDACGEGVARTFTLLSLTPQVVIYPFLVDLLSCTTLDISGYIFNNSQAPGGSIIKYPVTIQTAVTPTGGGAPLNFTTTHTSGGPTDAPYGFTLPLGTYTATVTVTDGCGNVYTNNLNIATPPLFIYPQVFVPETGCNDFSMHITPGDEVNPFTVSFISTPVGFNPLTYNASHPGPFNGTVEYYNPSVPLPPGTYTFQVTDACGRTAIHTAVLNFPPANVGYTSFPGCEPGKGSILIDGTNPLAGGHLISAPTGYPFPLPQDLAPFVFADQISMNNLIGGTYVFEVTDQCNNVKTLTVNIAGYQSGAVTANITEHCDSFDLLFTQSTNAIFSQYRLQKFFPLTNLWGHPITGATAGPNTGIIIYNNTTYFNVQSAGLFRILKLVPVAGNGSPSITCNEEIYTFEYRPGPRINHVYSIGCTNGTYDAIVDASGYPPLEFRITTKNGEPFFIDNGTSNIFIGLAPAVYNFQIEDNCGNILNSVLDVSHPSLFTVQPANLCPGQTAILTVPNFPFLNYQWWKDNNTATILSNTNSLSFPAFNPVTNAGVYHVRVNYPNSNSCIDLVLDFQVSPALSNPQAGVSGAATYCGSQGVIDLFTLLSGTYDNFGQWEELGNSGQLFGNSWNSANVLPGNYLFKYKVTGLCNVVDESTVDIAIKPVPAQPTASIEEAACGSGQIQLFATDVPNASYVWTGPNGFASTEQNPIIENLTTANSGMYIVNTIFDGCPSAPSAVQFAVIPSPEFTLNASCTGSAFMLSAIPGNAFPENISLSWTGPENFVASGNPIDISGHAAGVYEATVSTVDGCSFSVSVDVPSTLCGIPKGVSVNDDGNNDTWNLTGLDIEYVKIFNRYGMLVYEKERYVNEWKGQDKYGHILPSATYYYLVKLNSGESKTGWVYLIREN